jgi:DNA-binding CsgD family transcriptional regulator
MSWNDVPSRHRELAQRILTPLQLRIVQHRANGVSYRAIATLLGRDESTIRYHHTRALRRLRDPRKDAA